VTKYSAETWKGSPGQEMMQIGFEKGILKSSVIEKIAEKSKEHETSMTDSLRNIANVATDHTSAIDQNIQLAHLGRTGETSAAVSGMPWKEEVYKRADKATLSKLTAAQANLDRGVIISSVNPGKFKDVMLEMKDANSRDTLLHHARTFVTAASNKIAQSNKATANNDPQIKNL
jgi:hypothetical protein